MAKPGSRPTSELIRLAIIGDGAAFTELWDTHIDSLRSYIKSRMKNLDDFYVDDICSRSFEKAFRQIRNYDPSKSRFSTWLTNIAHNTAVDTVEAESRSSKRYVSIDQDFTTEEETPLESMIRDEDQVETEKYIDGLPELYRRIARMRLVDGLQYSEIAEETGLPLNTVRTRIRRAKAQIDKMKTEETI